ncbi:hypothetical protein [Argonema galeatum]|uniref:hypothetical protein n=1 Tax=Argonema galeatum TaxID=2942762 RepID=UPI0020123316|nr:hypothetical protein [Argonema galeatum]MCL1464065.1 hypothetical protein [Argonema galeatum A003/A1]
MKLELQKIEETLQQVAAQSGPKKEQPSSKSGNQTNGLKSQSPTSHQDYPTRSDLKVNSFSGQQQQAKKTPALPKIESPRFTSHRNGVNPYLAMTLLKEMETVVGQWQTELRQILRQIQDIYLDGPIIEGWLESLSPQIPTEVAAVPHTQRGKDSQFHIQNASGYRLVGWNADGKRWYRPCPPEELPSVSLALARYQKLQHLLVRKQELETHLTELAEVFVFLQGHIQTL